MRPDYDPKPRLGVDLVVIRLSEAAQVDPATLPSVEDILQVGDSTILMETSFLLRIGGRLAARMNNYGIKDASCTADCHWLKCFHLYTG